MNLLSERLAYIYQECPDLKGDRGQTGLAHAAGASNSVANQWLADKIKSMDIRYALRIEATLGFSHIWLMTGEGNPKIDREKPHVILTMRDNSEEIARLVTIYARANKSGREDIMMMAESVDAGRSSNATATGNN